MKKILRFLSLLLLLICIASSCLLPISASTNNTLPLEGKGTKTNPYLIQSTEDLCHFRNAVNNGNDFKNKYIYQTVDLDLSKIDNWTPIGEFNSGNYFYGAYNGGGHTISNLTIVDGGNAALFGQLAGAVMNLGIESGSIHGSCVGSIAGHSFGNVAKIINCYNKADISGYRVGGIADSFAEGIIADCWNSGTLTGIECGNIVAVNASCVLFCKGFDTSNIFTKNFTGYAENNQIFDISSMDIDSLQQAFHQRTKSQISSSDQLIANMLGNGTGTENDPYRIYTVEDLVRFRALVNTFSALTDIWVRQEVDLHLSEFENWTPIGVFGGGRYFYGTYDGNGHTISNLNISGSDNAGFFGVLYGTVLNLGIESGRIEGSCVGAIASHGGDGTPMIVNCYNKADVIGHARAGGIADNFSNGLIVNCLNTGNVTSEGTAGGICGYGVKRMINCYSVGIDVVSENMEEGVIEASCRQISSVSEAKDLLNDGLYNACIKTNLQHNNLLYRTETGGFGEHYNYLLRFVVQEILIAISLLLISCLFIIVWKSFARDNTLCLIGIKNTVLEGKNALLHSNTTQRTHWIVLGTFLACFGMMATGYLNNDSSITRTFVWANASDVFMDFLNPLQSVANNNYEAVGYYTNPGGTYPPIARFFFLIVSKIMPIEAQMKTAGEVKGNYGTLTVFFIAAICILLLFVLYRKMCCGKSVLFPLFAIFSAPMIHLFERGNLLMVVLVLCAAFLMGYRSKNPLIRHLSYICLAIAACMKFYPAALGLLLFREKNWKHVIQLVLYGVGFFLIPFFFIGGIPELLLYYRNISSSVGQNSMHIDVINYTNVLACWGEKLLTNVRLGHSIGKASLYPIMGLLAISSFLSKDYWKSLLGVSLIVVLMPGYSSFYCAAFLGMPMLAFVASEHTRRIDYCYALLIALTLVPLQFLCGVFGFKQADLFRFTGTILVLLAFVLIGDCIYTIIKSFRTNHPQINFSKKEIKKQSSFE